MFRYNVKNINNIQVILRIKEYLIDLINRKI